MANQTGKIQYFQKKNSQSQFLWNFAGILYSCPKNPAKELVPYARANVIMFVPGPNLYGNSRVLLLSFLSEYNHHMQKEIRASESDWLFLESIGLRSHCVCYWLLAVEAKRTISKAMLFLLSSHLFALKSDNETSRVCSIAVLTQVNAFTRFSMSVPQRADDPILTLAKCPCSICHLWSV